MTGPDMLRWSPGDNLASLVNSVAGRADVALLAADCEPPDGWVRRLRAAAYTDDPIAIASALPAEASHPDLGGGGRVSGSPLHPRVDFAWPACCLIRRDALDLVGRLDESPANPQGVLAGFVACAASHGLAAVIADDLSVSAGDVPVPPELAHAAAGPGRLRRAVRAARTNRDGLSVTVDARALGASAGGTQSYVGALVIALARAGAVSVRAVVADPAPGVVEAFEAAGAEVVGYEQAAARELPLTDVVHRPQQVFTPEDMTLLRLLGERVVVTHLDLIAYRAPSYHHSPDAWRAFRRMTRLALAAADRTVFLSAHAREDALAEDLVEPGLSTVIGIAPPRAGGPSAPRHRPPAIAEGAPAPLVLLGADYAHKNRPFAIRLLGELRRRHGFAGMLVLAGAHVEHGSSAPAEAALLASDPELAGAVIDLGPISEPEKAWLLANAAAVLAPSTYEGYGLTPLEAAAAEVPCLYAPTTSLGEVMGDQAATLVPWDPVASAAAAAPLLAPGAARERHLELIGAALRRPGWDQLAAELHELYRAAVASPYRPFAPRAWEELERERHLTAVDTALRDLSARVAHGLPLIDRGGLLSTEEQRGLMRIASRPLLHRALLGPVGRLGSIRVD